MKHADSQGIVTPSHQQKLLTRPILTTFPRDPFFSTLSSGGKCTFTLQLSLDQSCWIEDLKPQKRGRRETSLPQIAFCPNPKSDLSSNRAYLQIQGGVTRRACKRNLTNPRLRTSTLRSPYHHLARDECLHWSINCAFF
jgi:hypothetical protein